MQMQERIVLSSYSTKRLNANGTRFLKEPENEPELEDTVSRKNENQQEMTKFENDTRNIF